MAEIITYVCDGCGKQKEPHDKWFRAKGGTVIRGAYKQFTIREWESELAEDEQHFCGIQCAAVAMARAMQDERKGD